MTIGKAQPVKLNVEGAGLFNRETKSSRHINIIGHYDDKTLIDKDGKLIKLFEIRGIDFVTQSQLTLDILKNRRNSLFKTLSSTYAIYTWIIRKKATDYPSGAFKQTFAQTLNDKYRQTMMRSPLFKNVLYLAIMTKPPEGKLNKAVHWLKTLRHEVNTQAREEALKIALENLEKVTNHWLSAFESYQIRTLGVYHKILNGHRYYISEPLSFVDYLINGEDFSVRLSKTDARFALTRKRLFFNARSGMIEIRSGDHRKRFGATLSLKEYASHSYAGILDGVQRLPVEMIITQSYRFFDPHQSKTAVKDQRKDFQQVQDESVSQIAQLDESLDEATSGRVGFGWHHLSVLCFADSQVALNNHVATIITEFSKLDIACVREDLGSEFTYWSQLPGNFSHVVREAPISTRNLAGFMSFHNDALGNPYDNYWGEAVTVVETLSQSPYFFNHHYKDVGGTLIFGGMGSGKTILKGFLLTQGLKFGGKRIVFDKDRGLEILIRALGGYYEVLSPGKHTGFNPCQLADTRENRHFLNTLFNAMLTVYGTGLNESEAALISKVVSRMFSLAPQDRILRNIAPFLGAKTQGSLRARFDEWHSDGEKAWVFDHALDTLNLSPDIVGFELGKILAIETVKTPTLMYLMYRVNQALENQKGAIYIDEGWLALQDKFFQQTINNEARTSRKKNQFLCLSTQSAEDAAQSPVNKILCTSSPCKFFFPDPAADKELYRQAFGLTEREVELIKTLDEKEHYFLLKFGHGLESVVARLNLNGMEDEIAIISGRQSTVNLLDKIRAKVGDNPDDWMPIFLQWYKKVDDYV